MDIQNPPKEYRTGQPGFSKTFHIEQMRRIPHEMSPETRHIITASSQEGRLFPQALSDAFGRNEHVTKLAIDIVRKGDHFPFCEDVDDEMFRIRVFDDRYETGKERIFFVNMHDLRHYDALQRRPVMQAWEAACEVARLYYRERK